MAIERPDLDTLEVRVYPDKQLRQEARPLEVIDGYLNELSARMAQLMVEHEGIGLASTQVGWPWRLVVVNPSFERGKHLTLVNPVIIEREGEMTVEEGCLSVPEIRSEVRRAAYVRVRAKLLTGEDVEIEGRNLVARLFQHELDHLDGRLFVDRVSQDDRALVERRLKELKRRQKRR